MSFLRQSKSRLDQDWVWLGANPSKIMLYLRTYGTNSLWVETVELHAPCWTSRQRQRFAIWGALRMVKGMERSPVIRGDLLVAIKLCAITTPELKDSL